MASGTEFRRLAEQFRECHDEIAAKETAAQAPRLARLHDVLNGFEMQGTPWPSAYDPRDGKADRELWTLSWQSVVTMIVTAYPDRFSPSVATPRYETVADNKQGLRLAKGGIEPGDWKRQAMAWADVCIFIADQIDAKLDAGSVPEVGSGASQVEGDKQPDKPKAAGLSWQEAAERMEQLCSQGAAFTNQRNLAEQFGCSPSTIHKAIDQTPSLKPWATRDAAVPEAKGVTQRVGEVAIALTEQSRELDPEDAAAIEEHLERDLDPKDRGYFLGMSVEDQLTFLDLLADPDRHGLDEQVRIPDRRP